MYAGGLLCAWKYQWSDVFAKWATALDEGELTLERFEIEIALGRWSAQGRD